MNHKGTTYYKSLLQLYQSSLTEQNIPISSNKKLSNALNKIFDNILPNNINPILNFTFS